MDSAYDVCGFASISIGSFSFVVVNTFFWRG